MSRPLRLEFAGALYHVTSRGDRWEAIYEDDEDRRRFVELLGQVAGQFNWVCHAWRGEGVTIAPPVSAGLTKLLPLPGLFSSPADPLLA
jgi:hypothetical protein